MEQIRVWYPDMCTCGVVLRRGEAAWWNARTRSTFCESCAAERESMPAVDLLGPPPGDGVVFNATPHGRTVVNGHAEHTNDTAIDELIGAGTNGAGTNGAGTNGVLDGGHAALSSPGGVLLALTRDPDLAAPPFHDPMATRRVSAVLDGLRPDVLVLHDRRLPHARSSVDHLAVTACGVVVVAESSMRGAIVRRADARAHGSDQRLLVGRRDCTRALRAVTKQAASVQSLLASLLESPPVVQPMLCLTGAEWRTERHPFTIDGVGICWPRALATALRYDGPMNEEHVERVYWALGSALRVD